MSFLKCWGDRLQKFIDNPRAIIPFSKKYLYYNFIADKQLKYYEDFKYLSYEETLDTIIDNDRSIVRFGDELFDMIQGIGLYYGNWRQRYDPLLAKRMKQVISSKNPKLLVCFNPEFILKTKEEFKKEGIENQYQFWTNSKIFLKNFYHKDVIYGSALCFTPKYNTTINYKKLQEYFLTKHIIIITSLVSRFNSMNLGITTTFIEAPQSDAWQNYNEIKEMLEEMLKELHRTKGNTLILVSMGSAAKVLVYDMTLAGYTAWDTGQFFDLAFKEIEKIGRSY